MKITSFDGKEINVYVWDKTDKVVGTVQIAHGMAEHAARYKAFAEYLNTLGFVVWASDHRGHGLTDEKTLGYSKGDMFTKTVKDMSVVAEKLKESYPAVKHILIGHSYGSFLAQRFISDFPYLVDGVVLYGSSYKKDIEVLFGIVVSALGEWYKGSKVPARLIEKLSFGEYSKKFNDRQWLSMDTAFNRSYYEDKMCAFTCSNRFYNSFFHGLWSLYTSKYMGSVNRKLPLLLISGACDPVGDMGKGVKKLYHYYSSNGLSVDMHLIEGSRHVCLGEEKHRDEFLQYVTAFMNKVIHS